jgi:hypothetical protein
MCEAGDRHQPLRRYAEFRRRGSAGWEICAIPEALVGVDLSRQGSSRNTAAIVSDRA